MLARAPHFLQALYQSIHPLPGLHDISCMVAIAGGIVGAQQNARLHLGLSGEDSLHWRDLAQEGAQLLLHILNIKLLGCSGRCMGF